MAEARPSPLDPDGGFSRPRLAAALFVRERWLPALSLAAVAGLALLLNTWRLDENGWGNTYYAAAARSMTVSWTNFFFGAFDPGGFITVDKPPIFLWVDAISVKLFGYSSWSLLMPSALAGASSVGLVWLVVRRYAGLLAATIAALVLALSPISVAINRLNLPEPILILLLVGAAACTLRSLESERRWWLWAGAAGALVGVAFNTKMLAAWIPGPAFALAIVAGMPAFERKQLSRTGASLGILAVTTLAVSASWMLIVDSVPKDSRPYIGGSDDNTVYNLIVDYNGVGRVEGDQGPGGSARPPVTGNRPDGNRPAGNAPGANVPGRNPPAGAGQNNARGGIIAGSPGPWRMLDASNGTQVGWLLPFALLSAPVALWHWRQRRLLRASVVLFSGWVLLFGGVFSYAEGIYHSYYTAAMAPGIAILAALGVAAAVEMSRTRLLSLAAFIPAVATTFLVQRHLAGSVPGFYESAYLWGTAITGGGVAAILSQRLWFTRWTVAAGASLVVGGLLVAPAAWAQYEAFHPSMNSTLPQAGPREGAASRSFGSEAFDGGTSSIAAWLQSNSPQAARWDLVTTSAQQASTLIAAYNLSVLPLGGFSGSDPTISADDFAALVEAGEVRYVMAGSAFGGPGSGIMPGVPGTFGQRDGGQMQQGRQTPGPGVSPQSAPGPVVSSPGDGTRGANAVLSAVRTACAPVSDTALPMEYSGVIYDCADSADAIRTAG